MHHQRSNERLLLPDMSLSSEIVNNQKFLEDDLCKCGLCIRDCECDIQLLEHLLSITKKEIFNLKAGLCPDKSHDRECPSGKKLVKEQIAQKRGSAAAIICTLLQTMGREEDYELADNILGVVACLGTVQTDNLSRILAKYLGELQMLAIVCKSSAYASDLVKYGPDGQINGAYGLHALGTKLGRPISRQYLVICLEDIRAYAGDICGDSERKLALPDPTLSNGKPPPGFLGYAINMIDPDVRHWFWKTPSGHGLRETLFYHLFGELQVYETREDMKKASSCITEGAVSLDGSIIMKNGVFSFGNWPDIQFPVICSEKQRHGVEIMKQVEDKKQELQKMVDALKEAQEEHAVIMKNFWEKHDMYKKFLNENGHFLGYCYSVLGLTHD